MGKLKSFGNILAVVGLLIALVSVTPKKWYANVKIWHDFIITIIDYYLYFIFFVIFLLFLIFINFSSYLKIFRTRKYWWDKKIVKIIENSNQLIFIDSFQGHKHQFWTALQNKIKSESEFHLKYLILNEKNKFLDMCLEVCTVNKKIISVDKELLLSLQNEYEKSDFKGNKSLEFYFWSGISPGPIVAWKIKKKEKFGFGLWLQIKGSTDLVPWIVTSKGIFYKAIKEHCNSVLNNAIRIEINNSDNINGE